MTTANSASISYAPTGTMDVPRANVKLRVSASEARAARQAVLRDVRASGDRVFHLGITTTTIGRDPTNHITLLDPQVSRKHASVSRTPEGYLVVDLGSRHGTMVNGARVASALLKPGDEVTVGGTRLRFEERAPTQSDWEAVSIITEEGAVPVQHRILVDDPNFPPADQILDSDELRRDYERLHAAWEITRSIGIERELVPLLDRILAVAIELLVADRGAILLLLPDSGELGMQIARSRSGPKCKMVLSRTILNEVISTKAGVISGDAARDTRFSRSGSIAIQGIRSTMCVPMLFRGEILGVMHLESPADTDVFGDKELNLFTSIASQAALAVKNVLLQRRIEEVLKEEREREKRAAQAERMALVGQLAGGIAHDFNNLLTVILSSSEMLAGDSDPHVTEHTDMIREAARRAAELTRQLLAFSRRELIQPQVITLAGVLAGVEKLLRRTLGEDIALAISSTPAPWPVKADPGKLEQVLMNLAVNARDAMSGGGRLTIETTNVVFDREWVHQGERLPAGRYAVLTVSDTGCGMAPDVLPHVFEPFFTTKEKGKGTGLGLATVYGVIKQSGGALTVESKLGVGTSFRIFLPVTDEKPQTQPARTGPLVASGAGKVILVVEDEDAVRRLASRILRKAGYTVLEAHDGAEALTIVEQHSGELQLVLTDMIMPRMSGAELVGRLRERWPSLPALFMTGYTDREVDRAGLSNEPARVVNKPFTQNELLQRVQEAAAARELQAV